MTDMGTDTFEDKGFLPRQNDTEFARSLLYVPWASLAFLYLTSIFLWSIGNFWSWSTLFSIVIFCLASFVAVKDFRTVKASQPTSMAVITCWGRRYALILKEGKYLMARYWPLFIDFIEASIQPQNLDLLFRHIRCRYIGGGSGRKAQSGGAIEAEIGITFRADHKRLSTYITSGGVSPSENNDVDGTKTVVHDILRDIIGEALRQLGASYTWERMTFSTYRLTAILLLKLTELENSENMRAIKVRLTRISQESESEESEKAIADDVDAIHEEARKNGLADSQGLGLTISRINVVRIEIDRDDPLAKVADIAAKEEQEARGEMRQTEAVIAQARKFRNASKNYKDRKWDGTYDIPWERAYQLARLERDKNTTEQRFDFGGLDIPGIINALRQSLSGGKRDDIK